jgi:large subunit ribosomal protein L13
MHTTTTTKQSDIKRQWHLVDLKGVTLGRVSTKIAALLIGKGKTYYTPNLDCGDYVVAVNAKAVAFTGTKLTGKIYRHHTGHPGGFREYDLAHLMNQDPCQVIVGSVKGMLPKNKLRDLRLKHLKVFAGEKHPYAHRFNQAKSSPDKLPATNQ